MYVFDEMIDIGLKKGEKWTSNAHREVAKNALLCNPRITECNCLQYNVSLINKIPKEKIKAITLADLLYMGVYVNN